MQGYLSHSDLMQLRRLNTPTIYNGWEAISRRDRLECALSHENLTDYTPQMGPMVGYAVTVEYICSDKEIRESHPKCYEELLNYLASIPGPKVMMCKDLDSPNSIGSIFGEVTGNAYHSLGAVGAITDGFVRDVDEACYAGFKLMARRLGVGHAYNCPLRFGTEIEIFGAKIKPGMFVHADKYGFIAIPPEETKHLVEAVRFMDTNECNTSIIAGRETIGKSPKEIAADISAAMGEFGRNTKEFINSKRG